ncbi:gp34.36 [Bacillus phage SPO1]|uniref:Gp34.36 n=2 Tax=Okubovirus TaxID=1857845 RepID=B6V2V1_BPSP1|nr:gp34.36 [Bacillus phage SPO1]ACI91076.1 gp34.36 [Bacillus phage SPO1]UNY49132.1 hypothetical protein sp82g_195 [Bacillus phage SP82G]
MTSTDNKSTKNIEKAKGEIIMAVVSKAMKNKVEVYIQKYSEMKALEAQLKMMRAEIEEYMEKKNLPIIEALNGSVSFQTSTRPVNSALYTTYDIGVVSVLSEEVVEEVIATVIDRDKLNAFVKAGKADQKEVEKYKLGKTTTSFRVKPGITTEV